MTWTRSLRPPPSGWRGHPLNGRQCVRSAPQARSLCSQHAPAAFRTSAQLLTHRDKRPTSPGSTLLSRGGAIRCSHSVAVGCVRLHPTFRRSLTCRSRPQGGAGMSRRSDKPGEARRWRTGGPAAQSAAPQRLAVLGGVAPCQAADSAVSNFLHADQVLNMNEAICPLHSNALPLSRERRQRWSLVSRAPPTPLVGCSGVLGRGLAYGDLHGHQSELMIPAAGRPVTLHF